MLKPIYPKYPDHYSERIVPDHGILYGIQNEIFTKLGNESGNIFVKRINYSHKNPTMPKTARNTDKMISMIYEYQRYIQLNTQFIRELEKEGGDTRRLKSEVADLEKRIAELKLLCGYRY